MNSCHQKRNEPYVEPACEEGELSRKNHIVVLGLCIAAPFSCTTESGGGRDASLSCKTDQDCSSTQTCVARQCVSNEASTGGTGGGPVTTSTGGRVSTGGSTSTGNAGSSLLDGGVPVPDSSVAADGSPSGGSPSDGGSTDGPRLDAGERDAANASCSDRAWQAEEPVGGVGYSDMGGQWSFQVHIAGDGSAFAAWLATDANWVNVHAHASRYTPSNGWEPHLQFDEWPYVYAPESGSRDELPAVAASENGEAMVVWHPAASADRGPPAPLLISMRYASGWEAPVPIEGPPTYPSQASLTLGADAHGNFVVAWIENRDHVSMARYTRGASWGTIEEAGPPLRFDGGPKAGVSGVNLSTEAGGGALVVWVEGSGPYRSVAAERFDPRNGWSGRETLLDNEINIRRLYNPRGAIGSDGSAAVTWAVAPPDESHPIASTFSGSWSPPVNLDRTPGSGMQYPPAIATDSHGTFIVAWGEPDGAYASRFTPGGSWSPRTLLSVPREPSDAAPGRYDEWAPEIAMNQSGDAVVSWREYDVTMGGAAPIDTATYSRASGWTPPTRLAAATPFETNYAAPPTMDACGNATLVWVHSNYPIDVMAARRVHNGSWSSPLRIGSTSERVTLGIGSRGEAIASWTSSNGYVPLASVLK